MPARGSDMRMIYRLSPAVALLASAAVWGSDTPGTFEREVPADAHGVVEISSNNGTVDVTGWDRAAVSVKADLGPGVDRVEVTSSGGHTVVRVIQHSHSSFDWGHDETHLRVQVPKDSEVDVSAVSANVNSAGVLGAQRLKSVSGDIRAEIRPADIEAKSVRGDIRAEIGPADIEAKSVSGSLKLRGKGQPAKLHLSTVSGDLELKHAAGDIEATTVSGEATVE